MANTMFPTVAKAAGSKRTPPTEPKAIKYVIVLAVNGVWGIMRAFDQPVVWRSESGRGIPDQSCNCCILPSVGLPTIAGWNTGICPQLDMLVLAKQLDLDWDFLFFFTISLTELLWLRKPYSTASRKLHMP